MGSEMCIRDSVLHAVPPTGCPERAGVPVPAPVAVGADGAVDDAVCVGVATAVGGAGKDSSLKAPLILLMNKVSVRDAPGFLTPEGASVGCRIEHFALKDRLSSKHHGLLRGNLFDRSIDE